MTTFSITINGQIHGPMDIRDDLTMNDFLREHLGMTGTKFGCGAGQVPELRHHRRRRRRHELHQPDLHCDRREFRWKDRSHGRRPCQERAVVRTAKGFHRTLRVSMRILHGRLPQRRPGSARAPFKGTDRTRASSRKQLPKPGWTTCAAAPATSNIMRRCAM